MCRNNACPWNGIDRPGLAKLNNAGVNDLNSLLGVVFGTVTEYASVDVFLHPTV